MLPSDKLEPAVIYSHANMFTPDGRERKELQHIYPRLISLMKLLLGTETAVAGSAAILFLHMHDMPLPLSFLLLISTRF